MINLKINLYQNRNLGIELLRMIHSYFIVMVHCCKIKNRILFNLIIRKPFHVPSFFLISFYFFYNSIFSRNIKKIKARFLRLLIPYIIWPLLIFIFNNLFFKFFRFSQFKRFLSFKELVIQIIFGRKFHDVFWFQFNLIFITLLFTILSFALNKIFLNILVIFGIISYYLQYSSLNYNFFISYRMHISHSLGMIVEMMPIAVTGILLGSINSISKLIINKKKSLLYILLVLILILKVDIFNRPKGFDYPGITLNIGAILLFNCFGILLIDIKLNQHLILFILNITNYTGGVYYLHTILRDILKQKLIIIKNRNYLGAIMIYLLCYLICFFGNILFGKTKLKYLFQ